MKGKKRGIKVTKPGKYEATSWTFARTALPFFIFPAIVGCLMYFFYSNVLGAGDKPTSTLSEDAATSPLNQKIQLYTFNKASVVRHPHLHEGIEGKEDATTELNRRPFTQGLHHLDGERLVESAGLYEGSMLRVFDLQSGKTIRYVKGDDEDFAEGTCFVNGGKGILQLTWQNKKLLVYSADTLRLVGSLPIEIEGWGIASEYRIEQGEIHQDEEPRVWATTGGSVLLELELPRFPPELFVKGAKETVTGTVGIKREIPMTCYGERIRYVNELEYLPHRKTLVGSIFGGPILIEFDPESGECRSMISMAGLYNPASNEYMRHDDLANDVFNGVAWHPSMSPSRLLVTGKRWPFIFDVQLEEIELDSPVEKIVDIDKLVPGFFGRTLGDMETT